jgi:crotonobetainyl-CoA:carnitine CoA-transferase CaiB-like acyl-CoA transferase
LIVPIPHSEIPELKVPGIAVKLESNPGSIRLPPPKLGEHSEEILREFGFSDPDIQTLRAQGALG